MPVPVRAKGSRPSADGPRSVPWQGLLTAGRCHTSAVARAPRAPRRSRPAGRFRPPAPGPVRRAPIPHLRRPASQPGGKRSEIRMRIVRELTPAPARLFLCRPSATQIDFAIPWAIRCPRFPPGRGHGLLGRTYPHVAAASRPRADDARRAVRRSTHLLRTALALDPECIRSLPSRPSHTADHERMRRAQQGCLLPDFGGAWVRRRTPSRNGAPVHPRTRPASRRSPHPGGPQSSNPSEPTLRRASRC
jgi:hypothetical protein